MAGTRKAIYLMTVVILLICTLSLVYFPSLSIVSLARTDWTINERRKANDTERVGYAAPATYFQELERRKSSITTLMSAYVVAMETSRNASLGKRQPWIFPTTSQHVLFGYQAEYFEKLRHFSQVTTVYIEAEMAELDTFLVQEYYDYSSNDCEMVQKTAIKGRTGTNSFKPVCHSDIVGGARKDTGARRSMLSVGLPYGIQHSPLGEHQQNGTRGPNPVIMNTSELAQQKAYMFGGPTQPHLDKTLNYTSIAKEVGLNYTTVKYAAAPTDLQTQTKPSVMLLNYIHVVDNGVVFPDGNVISGDVQVVPFRCHITSAKFQQDAMAAIPVEEEIFTIAQSWGGSFFHGTIENLPRLALYYDFLQKHPKVKIHVANRHGFLTDILGISRQRLISGKVRARVVYVPAGNPCGQSLLVSVQALSVLFQESAARRNADDLSKRDTVVLIRRSSKRFFKHHDAILKMLQRHAGRRRLRTVVFGDQPVPGVRETTSLFSKALIVVAPHGAGESNILFSQPGTVLIEGLCFEGHRVNLCYRDLALSLGLRYYGLAMTKDCIAMTATDIEKPFMEYLNELTQISP